MKLWWWLRTGTAFHFHPREMEDEFRLHLETRIAVLEGRGLSRRKAERRAT